ncbi:F-box/kelch-repeat protein OR23 isoform X1 [Syzygium oleosum]|uniref:F-box/kelch-repeat protein OR23 isoform X1 n=1 Tax=Syzygium oleosum TaxID=219896 RepID=UPI0011D1E9A8|nr:F-box/kelch-repeat protein OR23 isoform X1 [Syzygium oleosum]
MVRSSSPRSTATPEAATLLPGLPNDVGALVLSFVPYPHQGRLRATCKSWRAFFSSKALISLRHRNPKALSHLLCIFPQDPSIAPPYLFDPHSLGWCPLPHLPANPHVYGLCNFASVSIGPHLYVLGGSHFDTRSFPLDRPQPSSSTFRFNFCTGRWDRLAPMISPRGSFACVAVPSSDQILVAGGGSRHNMFGAAGSRMSSVERYDIEKDEWLALDGLPRFRAGCEGFLVRSGEHREFWVMGGYGRSRTISGVFPVDEYYRDAVVLELDDGGCDWGKWREVGDMWEEGERRRLGKIVVLDDDERGMPGIFMLDENDIFRYCMTANRWRKESSVPTKATGNTSFGFVALDGELYVVTLRNGNDLAETRRSRPFKRGGALFVQVYCPRKKTWRTLVAKSPLHCPLDFRNAVVCTIHL